MSLPEPDQPEVTDLCTRCGLCCGGALFGHGELTEAEVPIAEQAGLEVQRVNGQARFCQPCRAFAGSRCSIYDVRPATCRSYRCELLKRFERGDVSVEEADRLIAEARGLERRVLGLLPAGQDMSSARAAWVRANADDAPAAEKARADPQLTLAMFLLNRMLDGHFRRPGQRMTAGWDKGMYDV